MRSRTEPRGTGRALRPVLLFLVLAVVVPSGGVLWFVAAAVRNERLAVRQKLVEAYRPGLQSGAEELDRYWHAEAAWLAETARQLPAGRAFAQAAERGAFEGVVIFDDEGRSLYPDVGPEPTSPGVPAALERARALEHRGSLPEAAEAYRLAGVGTANPAIGAQALLGLARCLSASGRVDEAVEILTVTLADSRYAQARDATGRLIAPQAQLLALELTAKADAPIFTATAEALAGRLRDYAGPGMPSRQRRFLMLRLRTLAPGLPSFPTLVAEDLAAKHLAAGRLPARPQQWTPSGCAGLWQMGTPHGRAVGLAHEDRLRQRAAALLDAALPGGVKARLLPPGGADAGEPLLLVPAGRSLPGWALALYMTGEDPFGGTAERRVALYTWSAGALLVTFGIVGLVGGRYLLRQARLARLKNDFVATVSHELKTPLAAVRMFAETLREGRYEGGEQAARYLDLLVRENDRLSRMIDNFLSFSRMERGRHTFALAEAEPGDIVRGAADVVRDRFRSESCRLDVEVEPDLPHVMVDADAMATVLINLLDNACKYSGRDKHVRLRAFPVDGHVCFAVEDNGIGMSRREARKAFDRFYQADTSLQRTAGGCGLGLSIVRFIVDAHGGTVDVETAPGRGSTFTVQLPAVTGPDGET